MNSHFSVSLRVLIILDIFRFYQIFHRFHEIPTVQSISYLLREHLVCKPCSSHTETKEHPNVPAAQGYAVITSSTLGFYSFARLFWTNYNFFKRASNVNKNNIGRGRTVFMTAKNKASKKKYNKIQAERKTFGRHRDNGYFNDLSGVRLIK